MAFRRRAHEVGVSVDRCALRTQAETLAGVSGSGCAKLTAGAVRQFEVLSLDVRASPKPADEAKGTAANPAHADILGVPVDLDKSTLRKIGELAEIEAVPTSRQ